MTHKLIKSALLSAALASAPIFSPVLAETVEVTVLNTRGEDGIYRPALRVIRGGTVTFIAAGEQGLTEAILRDVSQLRTWAGTNIPSADPNDPIDIQVTVVPSSGGGGGGGGKDCTALMNAYRAAGKSGPDASLCTLPEAIEYCDSNGIQPLAVLPPLSPSEYCALARNG